MPYACAHPAAVIALAPGLGRLAVPSALFIGSVVPDAWYFFPFLERGTSHGASGLLLFCLPAGLFAYAAFHLLLKQPLLALLPQGIGARAAAFACEGLPRAPWRAVVASLAAGALTHLVWDAFTHPGPIVEALRINHRVLQHASTLLGTAFVLWWVASRLRGAPRHQTFHRLPAWVRVGVVAVLLAVSLSAFFLVLLGMPASSIDWSASRSLLRGAGITSLSTLGFAFLAYCLLFRSISARTSSTGFDQREPM